MSSYEAKSKVLIYHLQIILMTTVLRLIHMKVLLRSVREDSVRIFLVDFYFGDQLQLKFRTGNMIGCLDIWLAIHGVIGPRNMKG